MLVTHLTGRQNAASGSGAAAPVPVTNRAGLEAVRVEFGGQVAFTVWHGNATHHFLFQPPLLPEPEMEAIVLGLFE